MPTHCNLAWRAMHGLRAGAAAILLLSLASCANPFLSGTFTEGSVAQVRACRNTVLLEAVIVPPLLPILPLIDASVFRGNFIPNAPGIETLHQAAARDLSARIGARLRNAMPGTVIAGPELYGSSAYQALGAGPSVRPSDYYSRGMADDYPFPKVYLEEGAFNVVDYGKDGLHLGTAHLKNSDPLEVARPAAQAFGADCVVIAASRVYMEPHPMSFGTSGYSRLNSQLHYYDREGRFLAYGYTFSEPQQGSASEMANVEAALGQLDHNYAVLAEQMFKAPLPRQ